MFVLDLTIDGVYAPQELRVPASAVLALIADEIRKRQASSAKVGRKGGDYVVTTWSWVPGLKIAGLSDSRVRVEGQSISTADVGMTASLRSPDSILCCLGAYVREGGADAKVVIGATGSERFVPVIEIGSCKDAIVTTE